MIKSSADTDFRKLAIGILAGRAHTRLELIRKLTAKGAPVDFAREIADEFLKKGVISEAEIAEDGVRLASQKLVGRGFIRQKLRARGVPEELVERELSEQVDADAEFSAALEFARKKLRLLDGVPREVKIRRIGGALSRRGFGSSVIRKALDAIDLPES